MGRTAAAYYNTTTRQHNSEIHSAILNMITSSDPAPLSATARPRGTPAAADWEVNRIIPPTQITGGLRLTRFTGFKCQKMVRQDDLYQEIHFSLV